MPAPSGKTTSVDSLSSSLSELGIELPKPPDTARGDKSQGKWNFF
jgi:hypothetical protein